MQQSERPVNSSVAFLLFCMDYHFPNNIEPLEFTGRSDRSSTDRPPYFITHSQTGRIRIYELELGRFTLKAEIYGDDDGDRISRTDWNTEGTRLVVTIPVSRMLPALMPVCTWSILLLSLAL
jgi:hypothetical protein